MRIINPSVELVHVTPNAAEEIEMAARTCYKSEGLVKPGSAEKLIKKLIDSQHDSTLEHAVASFRIICDRGISHEFVRHRIASFSQESTRYCNYGKDKFDSEITVVKPSTLNPDSEAYQYWRGACVSAETGYFELLDAGEKPQIARAVLPTCLKTEFVMTANLREWRHVIKLRTGTNAHPDARYIASIIGAELTWEVPEVFKDLEKSILQFHNDVACGKIPFYEV